MNCFSSKYGPLDRNLLCFVKVFFSVPCSFFCEKNMLALFLEIMRAEAGCPTSVSLVY